MKTASVHIPLRRKTQQFHAGFAVVQGNLDVLTLQTHLLHAEEQAVFAQHKFDLRRTSYLLGRLASKEAIKVFTGQDQPNAFWIDTGIFQFPIVRYPAFPNTQVSISHCEEIGLCLAFSEAHPLGLDIERIDAAQTDTILSQIADSEKLLLKEKGLDNIRGYSAIWSMKEALSKVLKTGLMLNFKLLKIKSVKVNGPVLETTFSNFGQYKAFSYNLHQNYSVSIVTPGRTTLDLQAVWDVLEQTVVVD